MPPSLDNVQLVVAAALAEADLESLKKLSDQVSVDWNRSQTADAPPPLMQAIYRLVKHKNKKYLDIIEWLVRQGVDPTRSLPDTSDIKVRLKQTKIPLAGHSAFSYIAECMRQLDSDKKRGELWSRKKKRPRDLLSQARRRMTVASVDSLTSQRHEVRVDKSVVDLWERVLDSTSDVSFQAADRAVCAHSLVLLEASPVLKAMLQSPMREAGTHEIEVRDTSSAAVVLFLETLYTCSSRSEPSCQDVVAALDLAHRWQVPGVVGILAEVLQEMITETDFVAIAEAALLKDLRRLKDACKSFGQASKTLQDQLQNEEFPQMVKDLIAAGPCAESAKKRRRF